MGLFNFCFVDTYMFVLYLGSGLCKFWEFIWDFYSLCQCVHSYGLIFAICFLINIFKYCFCFFFLVALFVYLLNPVY